MTDPDTSPRAAPSTRAAISPRAAISSCAVAVDVALLTVRSGRLRLLLVRPEAPDLVRAWALPGRRVRDDEGLDETAHRALGELARLAAPDAHLEQLRTYGDVRRDPGGRVVSVAYLALTPTAAEPPADTGPRWWDVEQVTAADGPELAYDHARIVPDALERARAKLEYTALATAFVDEPFTLAELRRVYEAVWGVPLDPANFRRKVLSVRGFVVPTPHLTRPGPDGGRPARRYRRGPAARLHPAMLRP